MRVPRGSERAVDALDHAADVAWSERAAVEVGECSEHVHTCDVGDGWVAEVGHLEGYTGVKSEFVDSRLVDVFHDVDLTGPGPVGAVQPVRAPHAAYAAGVMTDVCDPQGVHLEGVFGLDARRRLAVMRDAGEVDA